jgi:hypothetical protein
MGAISPAVLRVLCVLCTTNLQILCVPRRTSSGFRLAVVFSEVPEGRQNVAHSGSCGEAYALSPKPCRGGTLLRTCAAPTGLEVSDSLPPTTSVVGYVISSLRDWAGMLWQTIVRIERKSTAGTCLALVAAMPRYVKAFFGEFPRSPQSQALLTPWSKERTN